MIINIFSYKLTSFNVCKRKISYKNAYAIISLRRVNACVWLPNPGCAHKLNPAKLICSPRILLHFCTHALQSCGRRQWNTVRRATNIITLQSFYGLSYHWYLIPLWLYSYKAIAASAYHTQTCDIIQATPSKAINTLKGDITHSHCHTLYLCA